MTAVFADTFYFLALLNVGDEAHADADRFATDDSRTLLTTAWVLTEVADGLAQTAGRRIVERLFHDLESDSKSEVVPPEPALWRRGVELYARRPDKGWSLTDCISFVVMTDHGVTDALTADHHFEQAGFKALLK